MRERFKPVWVIQTNCLNQDQVNSVAFAVNASDGKVVEAKVVPFTEKIEYSEDPDRYGPWVIPYGSTKMTKMTMGLGWIGSFYNSLFSTVVWNEHRDDMLNQDCKVMTVDEAVNYLQQFPLDLPMFVRPCGGLKSFAGAQVDVQEMLSWMKTKTSGNFVLTGDLLVSISPAKNILAEQRWFIVDGKVVDGSIYRNRRQVWLSHIVDNETIAEIQTLADKWLPSPCCVMDVALTDDGYKVIEFNCMNSSGFYAHDIPKVITAVNDYVCKLQQNNQRS